MENKVLINENPKDDGTHSMCGLLITTQRFEICQNILNDNWSLYLNDVLIEHQFDTREKAVAHLLLIDNT